MKNGMKYINELTSKEMFEFLAKCTANFEYCPIPGMSNTALYNDECPKQVANRKQGAPNTKEAWLGVDCNLCEKCVKEWLGIKEQR